MPLIYCVEDDENIRELVGYALRSQDFEVETFADSREFWPALENRMPALLLLDIMMPGESGNDILDKLHKSPQYKSLPVIMLTAKTSEYDIVKGLDGGADDYVCKPFGIVELISRIRAVLQAERRSLELSALHGGVLEVFRKKIFVRAVFQHGPALFIEFYVVQNHVAFRAFRLRVERVIHYF